MLRNCGRLALLALFVGSAGCPGSLENPERFTGGGADGGSSAKCADIDIPALIQQRCDNAGCHGTMMSAAGLDLISPNPGERLVGVAATSDTCSGRPLVDPETPANSVIIDFVSAEPTCGTRMPLGGEPLSADEVECMTEWAAALSGGEGDPAGGMDGGMTGMVDCSDTDVPQLLAESCGGNCHAGANPSAGLSLVEVDFAATLKDQPSNNCDQRPFVDSMDPDNSVLVHRLQPGLKPDWNCGGIMPPSGPLSEKQITCIAQWAAAL